ncbi:hypothetical protein BJF79_08680 [Actinomadura sp. CNU-125]|uniref:hypothetical protein n=1 Tax=Actinomadura sp. CNU-125 TaxID=1904961 RepID=UPI0009601220|nr:hypothetical protein [Actinomadura sp. CNU-125]OLT31859.1 hypothetical protein BJF79_08680 [Actinomadura sp. CNU-125]
MSHTFALLSRQVLGKAADRLAEALPCRPPRDRRLADDYGHADVVGLIGAGADALLRAILVEAMILTPGSIEVVMGKSDLEHLFGEMTGQVPRE